MQLCTLHTIISVHSICYCGLYVFSYPAVRTANRHADRYRGKRVVIAGIGTSACDAAVELSNVCSQVHTLQSSSADGIIIGI